MTAPVTLSDAVQAAIRYQLSNLNTALPAKIIEYDYQTRKASVQPVLNRVYTDGIIEEMPIITNVPLLFPGSSNITFSFPVNSGDYCLLIFSQRSLDQWLPTGGIVTPLDPRKFDLSDAIAIPGLRPFNETWQATSNNEFLIEFKGSQIKVLSNGDIILKTGDKVAIGNPTTELLDVVSQLMGLLTGANVMGLDFNGPLDPTFIASITSLKAQLDAIKGIIT